MSELKEHLFCECDECIREYRGPLSNEMRPYYLKSEVDKVIADNDAEIVQLQAMLEERNKQVGKLTENVRRLKRSLWHAIALFCSRSCEYFNGIMSHCLIGQDDLYRQCEEKKNKYLNAVYKCRAKEKEYK